MAKRFTELNAQELWNIREQVVLNSLYFSDFNTAEGYYPVDLSNFFDEYVDYLSRIAEEQGGEWYQYDNIDNLFEHYQSYDYGLDWIRFDDEVDWIE